MKLVCTGLLAGTLLLSVPANAIEPADLNRIIAGTNFVVDDRCSGTLISADKRLILTNYHCVDDKIRVRRVQERQDDGTVKEIRRERRYDVPVAQHHYSGYTKVGTSEYLTDIVAAEKSYDLALLQLKTTNHPYTFAAQLLPTDAAIERSQTVWAVGNPMGLDASVSRGVIASTSRTFEVPWAGDKVSLLQIDALINFGSSGGALYDDRGYLIGVPAAILAREHGLAIPVETIQTFLSEAGYNGPQESE